MSFFPLSKAYLCADCDCVSNNACVCPQCGSRALLSVGRVLGQSQPQEFEDDIILQMERESRGL